MFVAIDLDESVRAVADRSARALAARLSRGDQSSPVRWVVPKRLHLTLRFLGEVPDPRIESVRGALRAPWVTRAFRASLTGADLFPYSGAPRVVWLGVDEGMDGMVALKTELDRRLAAVGFEPETKPFRAHLTLGRVRRGAAISGAAFRAVLRDHRSGVGQWLVDRVTLYESVLSFRKASYRALETAVLAAAPQPEGRRGS